MPFSLLRYTSRLNLGVRPVKNYRATHDQKVIDAWAAQIARRKRGIGKTRLFLLLALALLGTLMYFAPSSVAVWLFFGVGAALVITQLVDRRTLLCPNCRQSPISTLQRGTSENSDFCVHCYYWLKSPYGDSHDARV